jgi:thiamine-monophosphate kinase
VTGVSSLPGPSADRTVSQIGEDGLVADVLTRYPGADFLPVGPGDDAAVLNLTRFGGQLVACTDTLVEGLDFRRDWSSAPDVGVKVAAQNFADVAAMGGRPHALLVSLVTPGSVPASWAAGLADGVATECARAGAVVAGGDLSEGAELVVTGTALGTVVSPVLRSGARPGDVVALSGATGRSGAGLALLRAGTTSASAFSALIAEHRRPVPPYSAGPAAAAAGATAMIDTSDGLVRDAMRLATASTVTLALSSSALTPDRELREAADRLGADPLEWVLTGGEDHQLLACFPASAEVPPPFRVIGTVLAGSGEVLLDGRPTAGAGGWRHF